MPALTFGKKICHWCVQHEAAQRGEEVDDAIQPVMSAPWVKREAGVSLTQILFGANVMVFLAMAYSNNWVTDFPFQLSLHFGANVGPYTLSGQWWRLVTYMFLHGGIFHIAMNMWCLWSIGTLCESLYGRFTYAAIYLITGVGGGLASVAWNPGVWSVGASGALFGLTGALIASFYLGEFSLSGINIKSTLSSLLFFTGFNLFLGRMIPGIDNACHVGGLVSGLILGALIALAAPERDKPMARIGILLFVAVLLAGSAVGVYRWRGGGMHFGAMDVQRNIDRMIGVVQKKVQQDPQDPSAHYALAHAYFTKGQFQEGENELKRVLELQPQNTKARRDLGAAYLSQSQPKEAHAEFANWLTQEPNNAEAHVWLGMALSAEQNPAAAIYQYEIALKLDPQAEGVYYKIGLAQAQLKKYDDAIASYLKEQGQTGEDPDLEEALADAYRAKGMQQQAQDARNKAAQLRGQGTD